MTTSLTRGPQIDTVGHFQSKSQLRCRLRKCRNRSIVGHQGNRCSETDLNSPIYNGDTRLYSVDMNKRSEKDTRLIPEIYSTIQDIQTAGGILSQYSFHSSNSVMSTISPHWECHDVSPGNCPGFLHHTHKYDSSALEQPGAELPLSQWPMVMGYNMLPEGMTHDPARRFYTAAFSDSFMRQPAHVAPFPAQLDWVHTPGCQLVFQPPQ
ncbi:hypothetical protein BDV33DRAFT_229657 [Aspergillus novoparasiticus]|uniref:Uncharacterized protein n=1 Tax=Aspergillus novoparasiticus TaxID=986946 RepID=A0A5N6E7X3_9EURO|nr:hypothetical protein BDV33DRAFT_229657 [Aspergillus novoparasiticus]